MAANKDFEDLLRCLNQEQAEYIVVGAYAVIFYTEPRYTKDLDIWVNPIHSNAIKVYRALKKFGAPVSGLSVEDLTNTDLVYQIGIEPNRIDLLMGIKGLKFSQAWKNRKRNTYGPQPVFLLELKDLIKAKKAAGRPQDLLDLEKLKHQQKVNQKREKNHRTKK